MSSHKFVQSFGRTDNDAKSYANSSRPQSAMGGKAISIPSFGGPTTQFRDNGENEMSDHVGMMTVDNDNSEIYQGTILE